MAKSAEKPPARPAEKPITFMGSSLDDLRDLPRSARREAGFQLDRVQNGEDPDNWKPMSDIGSGACEIRVRDETGIFRAMYVAKFKEAVYVFQKKTQKTSRKDLDLAEARYREMTLMRKGL